MVSPPRKSATEPRAAVLATGTVFLAKSQTRSRRGAFSGVSSISVELDMGSSFLEGLVLIILRVFFAVEPRKPIHHVRCIGERSTSVNVELLVLFFECQIVVPVYTHLQVVLNSHATTSTPQIGGFVSSVANFSTQESKCARQNNRGHDCKNRHGESFQSCVTSHYRTRYFYSEKKPITRVWVIGRESLVILGVLVLPVRIDELSIHLS
nr:MAG TPA: hypothetical protein [Caudoviricetes sp.]